MGSSDELVSVRLTPDLMAAVERAKARINELAGFPLAVRSDALRKLIISGDALPGELAKASDVGHLFAALQVSVILRAFDEAPHDGMPAFRNFVVARLQRLLTAADHAALAPEENEP